METVYKDKKKKNNNITDEERVILNNPTYLHKCTKCGDFKPNTEYYVDNRKAARKFKPYCKSCQSIFKKTPGSKTVNARNSLNKRRKYRLSLIYSSAKGNAKTKGVLFTLKLEDIQELWTLQNGLCYYTGKPMYKDITGLENSLDSASIDKKIPSLGYVKDNIVLCRWVVNRIKSDLLIEEFLQISEDIKNNLKWQPLEK